jgi:FHS family L-fucose permease-like MFS transporter
MGAVELSEMKKQNKQLLLALLPLAGAVTLWSLRGPEVAKSYLPFLLGCWLLFQFGRANAGRTLTFFALAVVALLATAVIVGGRLAMWCVVGVGLFTSIGWSNTFSLAIEGLGSLKSQAASLLVMAILGGAILPPIQGFVADHAQLQWSFIVPLIAYAYVAFYGWKGHRVGRG